MNRIILIIASMTLTLAGARIAIAADASEKKTLSLEGAHKAMAAAQAFARSRNVTPSIAFVDDGGNLILVERMEGGFPAGANVSIGKARTSAMFRKPTRVFEEAINKGRTAMLGNIEGFTPLQGGVPIIVDGQVIGAVGVSGASSAAEDEEVAIAGANAIAPARTATTSPTTPVIAVRSSRSADLKTLFRRITQALIQARTRLGF